MTDLKVELLRILTNQLLTPVFQPIVSVNHKKIIGYEALIRGPADSPLHSPLNLFDTAEHYDLQARLEFACREITIKQFASLKLPGKLFINVSPSVLLEPGFKKGETLKFIQKSGLHPNMIIIELTEHQPTNDYRIMKEAVEHYRSMGFEIALDDLGAGYSGLRLWSELQPEYVKIDKHFVQGLHENKVKFNFVKSIRQMASAMNCKVIAEGIEVPEELDAILKIGITHAQGFYFARPSEQPPTKLEKQVFFVANYLDCQQGLSKGIKIESISRIVAPINADTAIDYVLHLFQQQPEFNILPVIDDGLPIGLIMRDKFFSELFSSRYGIELHGKRPIHSFIHETPFTIDKNTPIELVSKQLTNAMRHDQAFMITDNAVYFGIATMLDLLGEITQQQINNAKHANPLTLLPGSVPVNQWMDQLLDAHRAFCVGYFDLDHFKPYNDVYGYNAGDEIIKALADTLTQCVPADSGYVGHIGGDDFIVVFIGENWFQQCQNILAAFQLRVSDYYKATDVEAGGFYSEDRTGQMHFFPLISLSVGLVDSEATGQCQSHVDIADLASEAKKQAKKESGNSFFINRRQTVGVSPVVAGRHHLNEIDRFKSSKAILN